LGEETEWKKLVGYALYDKEFRRALLENPEKAVREAGFAITLTKADIAKFKKLQNTIGVVRKKRGPDEPAPGDWGW